jgi:hypothetical protein
MAKKWIKKAISHPGALHRMLGIKPGAKIGRARLMKASHSKSPLLAKRARLAITLSHLR